MHTQSIDAPNATPIFGMLRWTLEGTSGQRTLLRIEFSYHEWRLRSRTAAQS